MANPFSNLNDKELMLKYQDGDSMAFEVLYERHNSKIYSYISKRLHKEDDREDLYQRVFMKLHKSRKLYDPKYEVLPWFYTITRSEFLDFIKKKKLKTVEFNESVHGEVSEVEGIDVDLSGLSKKEMIAIEERYFNDRDFSEISKLLETSESNARKLISRGLKKLRGKS